MKSVSLFFICIALIITLSGCDLDMKAKLGKAESFMEEQPAQALSLLDEIDKNVLTTGNARAEHALLYSMALDKNYIDTADVNVAMPAVKYYDRHGPAEKAMKAWFYLGREQENGGNYNEAIVSYTRAREFAKESDDARFKALLASAMADLYSKTYNNEEHIAYSAEAYRLYEQSGDTLNCWIATGALAEAYSNAKMWDKADSLFNIFFSCGITDDYRTTYYQLSYASKLMRQPVPEPRKAVELIEGTGSESCIELSIYEYGLYAYAYTLLGDLSMGDEYLAFCEKEGLPEDTYNWKYDIYKERGDYKKALYELETIFHNQENMIDGILSQSISRTQRDYFQTKAELIEHDRNHQKAVKTIFILISLLAIMLSALIVLSIRRKLQFARDRIAAVQSESGLYCMELERKIENISKEELGRREKLIYDLNKSYIRNYRLQFKLIDELCAEYWMSEHSRDRDRIYRKVRKIVSAIYNGSGKDSEFEARINSCLDNVMQKLRTDFPKYKEEDFRLLSYVIAGFEAKTISMIMDLSTSNVYSRKCRMKERILSASTDNTELYRSCL